MLYDESALIASLPMTVQDAKLSIEDIARENRGCDNRHLRGALRLLAEELNSKESHFILELIQNAEDNHYDAENPSLHLRVIEGNPTGTLGVTACLIALNNERGFRQENVRSLSSVGQSTKKKGVDTGYIGEKGIGFKSVFRVTDEPHIFSGPFQFKFKKPSEAEPLGYILPHWVDTVPDEVRPGFTAILLPLLPGRDRTIAAQLQAIAPETLLFLRKIRTLRLGEDREISVRGAAPRMHLLGRGSQSEYFVSASRHQVPDHAKDERRADTTDREITIAFPIHRSGCPPANVFAFLPTEIDSGLPFLINADFVGSSSREGILEERPWNIWMRDRIGDAFTQALLRVLEDPELREGAHRFLPGLSEVDRVAPFFRPVTDDVHAQLRNESCVLTEDGQIARPAEVVDASIRDRTLLTRAPQRGMMPRLLHPAWSQSWSDRLKPLGVGRLSFELILAAFNEPDWLERQDTAWWVQFLECSAAHSVTAQSFGSFPVLKCHDGRCRTAQSQHVYLHPAETCTSDDINPRWPIAHFIDRDLQEALRGQPLLWKWFTQTFRLPAFSVEGYILNSLLDWIQTRASEGKLDDVVRATVFVARNLPESDDSRRRIAGGTVWIFDDGSASTVGSSGMPQAVTPEGFQHGCAWEWIFVNLEDRAHLRILHKGYSTESDAKASGAIWTLMRLAGISDVPLPASLPGPDGCRDYVAPKWLRDLGTIRKPEDYSSRIGRFEDWLDHLSKSNSLGKLLSKSLFYFETASVPSQREITAFGATLQSVPWLATTDGFNAPAATFLDTLDTRSFLSDDVPYSTSSLNPAILRQVGVQASVSANTLTRLLRRLRDGGARKVELVLRIYQRLRTESFDARIFAEEPLIWLAVPESRWCTSRETVWKDYGTAFDGLIWSTERTYGDQDLRGFFIRSLGVPEEASTQRMVEIWTDLSGRIPDSYDSAKAQLAVVYRTIAGEDFLNEPWWSYRMGSLRIWKTEGDFGEPSEVFVPDSGYAARILAGVAPVAWLPVQVSKGILQVLMAAGCRSLRQSLRTRLTNPADDRRSPRDCVLLTPASKELLFLLAVERKRLSKMGAQFRALFRTTEYLVGEVAVEYSLQDSPWRKPEQVAAYWSAEDSSLFVADGTEPEDQRTAAARFLAGALFDDDADAETMIFTLLTKSQSQARIQVSDQKWEFTEGARRWLADNGVRSCLDAQDAMDGKSAPANPPARFQFPSASPGRSGPPGITNPQGTLPIPGPAPGARDATSNPKEHGASIGTSHDGVPDESHKQSGVDGHAEDDADESDYNPTDSDEGGNQRPVKLPHEETAVHTDPSLVRSRSNAKRPPNTGRRERTEASGQQQRPNPRQFPNRNAEVEKAAMAHVVAELKRMFPGCELHDRSKSNCGYDLLVKMGILGSRGLRIEVKGHSGAASSIIVTPNELEESRRKDQSYDWELWNITNLASEERVTITRYTAIPESAILRETGHRVDLSRCVPVRGRRNG